jgi:cytochrome c5
MERKITMRLNSLFSRVFALASISVFTVSAQEQSAPQAAHPSKAATAAQPVQQQSEGERAFQQHCSRCHNAPEGFSPRISGTIVRHMRVRASLSQHEEDELLHFFNP